MATLQEIETRWSINDLFDAHEALDIKMEHEQAEADRVNKK